MARRLLKLKEFPWLLVSLGDFRRTDGRSILERFTTTKMCCLPPGLARLLRERDLTIDTLLSMQWRRYFLGLGFSVFTSIASVEKRHRHHRGLADPKLQWHNFAAMSVTGEAQRLQDACATRAAAERPASSAAIVDMEPHGPVVADVQEPATKILKAKSTYTLYHKSWLQEERSVSRCWNPATQLAWEACGTAFDALSDAERQTYRMEAVATVDQAKANRALRQEEESEESAAQAVASSVVGERPPNQLVALEDLPNPRGPPIPLVPLGAALAHGCNLAATATTRTNAVVSPAFDGPPISPDTLANFFLSPLEDGKARQARMEESNWIRRTTSIAPPAAAGPNALPEHVKYAEACGAICRFDSSVRDRRLHAALLQRFRRMALDFSPTGKAAAVALADVVFVAESYIEGFVALDQRPDAVSFFALTDAAGRFGRFREVQMFIKLSVDDGKEAFYIKNRFIFIFNISNRF